jgi:hypothetical protein
MGFIPIFKRILIDQTMYYLDIVSINYEFLKF